MNKHLVSHWNIGVTLVPAAKNALGDRGAATGYNLGQSFVWLVRPRFNALLETTWIRSQAVVSRNRVESFHDLLLTRSGNPGNKLWQPSPGQCPRTAFRGFESLDQTTAQ
jgi:hypothetical protein